MVRAEEKLFRAIRSKHEKRRPWKKETMEILGLGKSAFYNRVNGHTPLLLEEAIRLSQHFDVPFREWEDQSNPPIFKPLEFSSFSNFLDYWNTFLQKVPEQNSIIIFASSLPLFPLFQSSILLQYYVGHQEENAHFIHQNTNLNLEVQDLMGRIVTKTSRQKRKEVWTPQLFDNYQNRLLKSISKKNRMHDSNDAVILTHWQDIKSGICKKILHKSCQNKPRISSKIVDIIPFGFLCCDPNNNILIAELWQNYWVEIRQPDFIQRMTWKVEHLYETGFDASIDLKDLF